ncbi:hypothetical protein H6P81_012889 [Aristolochia fimbriata]|uniref:Uncharacterized protein n=1 Tax=Aristolochia fimbriata TaxID=158543 RepID=A0AAV7EG84_ARIFI|nr:hypothetical protein H6P81_012889 [Aristolochia fimbriata]
MEGFEGANSPVAGRLHQDAGLAKNGWIKFQSNHLRNLTGKSKMGENPDLDLAIDLNRLMSKSRSDVQSHLPGHKINQ